MAFTPLTAAGRPRHKLPLGLRLATEVDEAISAAGYEPETILTASIRGGQEVVAAEPWFRQRNGGPLTTESLMLKKVAQATRDPKFKEKYEIVKMAKAIGAFDNIA